MGHPKLLTPGVPLLHAKLGGELVHSKLLTPGIPLFHGNLCVLLEDSKFKPPLKIPTELQLSGYQEFRILQQHTQIPME